MITAYSSHDDDADADDDDDDDDDDDELTSSDTDTEPWQNIHRLQRSIKSIKD